MSDVTVLQPDQLRGYSRVVRPVFVIDIETTGLERDADIIEFGIYDYRDDSSWGTLVKNERYSANRTTHVTGLTDDDLRDAPGLSEAIDALSRRVDLRSGVFIAHNGRRFDFPRINRALSSVSSGYELPAERTVDSLNIAKNIVPWHESTAHSIAALIDHYGIVGVQEHRAASDCEFTSKVLDSLLLDAARRGVTGYESVESMIESSRSGHTPSAAEKAARDAYKALVVAEQSKDVPPERLASIRNAYDTLVSRI